MRRIVILLSIVVALLSAGPLSNAMAAANAAREQARVDRTWLAARDSTQAKRPPVKPSPTPVPTTPAPSPTPGPATPTPTPAPTTPAPTTPAPTTPAPTASVPPRPTFGGHIPAGVVGRVGEQLALNGRPYRFTGVNAYQLATDFSMNIGCGNQVRDLDALFRGLRPDSMVRFWAFQNQAFNKNTRKLDFTSIDRVVRAAERNGQRLVLTFGEQAGVCDDGHWKDMAWYQGDHRRVFDDEGRGQVVSYWDWMHMVVERYKTSPAVGMWELLNEPQVADCPAPHRGRACYGQAYCPPGHAEVLRDFFTVAGQEIKRIDPHHLVSSGTNAHGECGVWEQYFEMAGSSPGIDVLSIHDYDPAPLIDLTRNHLYRAQRLNKPVMFGEVGTDASPSGGNCYSLPDRAGAMQRKLDTVLEWRGVAGFLTWEWVEQRESWQQGCSLAVTPNDPMMNTLRNVNLRVG